MADGAATTVDESPAKIAGWLAAQSDGAPPPAEVGLPRPEVGSGH